MLSSISANSIRRSTIACDIFSRPNPRSEPLTSTPRSATRSPQKRPHKARHNRRTYDHERRVGERAFPLNPKSPTPSGFLASRSRKIRDPNLRRNPRPNHAHPRPLSSPSSQCSEHPVRSRSVFLKPADCGLLYCFCLRRSTLTRRVTPLAPLEMWRVASPTPRLNTKAGFINSMSYSLPKYYFQDIHPDVMEEIMHGMQEG